MLQRSVPPRKTLDWGGKGGKGGGNEGLPKIVLHDSIFSCDRRRSRRMRSFLRSFLVYFFFLDLASCNLRVREDFLTKQADRGCAAGDVFVGGEGAFGQKGL